MIGNERSYRQLGRLAEMKAYNDHHKRAFGRDITNMEKKSKKNTSIYEKPPAFKMDARVRSRSLYGPSPSRPTRKLWPTTRNKSRILCEASNTKRRLTSKRTFLKR